MAVRRALSLSGCRNRTTQEDVCRGIYSQLTQSLSPGATESVGMSSDSQHELTPSSPQYCPLHSRMFCVAADTPVVRLWRQLLRFGKHGDIVVTVTDKSYFAGRRHHPVRRDWRDRRRNLDRCNARRHLDVVERGGSDSQLVGTGNSSFYGRHDGLRQISEWIHANGYHRFFRNAQLHQTHSDRYLDQRGWYATVHRDRHLFRRHAAGRNRQRHVVLKLYQRGDDLDRRLGHRSGCRKHSHHGEIRSYLDADHFDCELEGLPSLTATSNVSGEIASRS